jgi:DNA-binding transcriptional ArsR family regulator
VPDLFSILDAPPPPDVPHLTAPAARNTDPVTSHQAAREITADGSRDRQAAAILAAVRDHPDETAAELAGRLGMERAQTSKRLPELRRVGLVENPRDAGGELLTRACRVTRKTVMLWRSVKGGGR